MLASRLLLLITAAVAKANESTAFPTYVRDPTPKPTSPCTGNTPDWKDSYDDGCEWYERTDLPGCPYHGDNYGGEMGVANDNCCYCAGTAAPMITPPPTPYPTFPPTASRSPIAPSTQYPTWSEWASWAAGPTEKPTSPCTGNTPDWRDSNNVGCEWYEMVDMPGCPFYGNDYEGTMGVSKDNCCFCAMTLSPTMKPTSPCTGNTIGWKDSNDLGCDWYEWVDMPGCPYYGNDYEGTMGVAKDNCCYCAMSLDPTPKPSLL